MVKSLLLPNAIFNGDLYRSEISRQNDLFKSKAFFTYVFFPKMKLQIILPFENFDTVVEF